MPAHASTYCQQHLSSKVFSSCTLAAAFHCQATVGLPHCITAPETRVIEMVRVIFIFAWVDGVNFLTKSLANFFIFNFFSPKYIFEPCSFLVFCFFFFFSLHPLYSLAWQFCTASRNKPTRDAALNLKAWYTSWKIY